MKRGAITFVLLTATLLACRKPPRDEIVYTGRTEVSIPAFDAGLDPIDGGLPTETFSRRGLLQAVAACALDRFDAMRASSAALALAVDAWAVDPARRADARNAWLATMVIWQEAELFRIGPASARTMPGGLGLRDQIYGWPLVNRCKVEEQLVAKTYESATFGDSVITGRGLGALEYLLFHEGTDNACSQFSPINGDGTWAALGEGELAARKIAYAQAVAAQVARRATELHEAWSPSGGNFVTKLGAAGAGSEVYATDQDGLNAISDAMFYVEHEVKDLKLARAIGLAECLADTCPEALESQWAHRSKEHVLANLRGFRRIFAGCGEEASGLGFDDWLVERNRGDLATDMLTALAGATLVVESLDGSFEVTLATEPDRLRVVHAGLKVLTDLLKVEMTGPLDLELPQVIEGDND
jgi:uncharacterized protein